MKKVIAIVATILTLNSCTQDIQSNNPGFQAKLDNVYWKATDASFHVNEDGSITISAYTAYEELILETASQNVGTYVLGTTNESNFASYYYNNNVDTEYEYDTSSSVKGPVFKLAGVVSGGTNYYDSNNAATLSTSTSGNGLKLSIQANTTGQVTSADVISRGLNYSAGENVTILGGDNNAVVRVLNTQYSNGEITIESIQEGRLTGTFKLNASDGNGNVITISEGVFYQIPIR